MITILGATGHVGSAVAKNLLNQGEDITIITHDPQKIDSWKARGAEVAVVDIHDTKLLGETFAKADRLFLLNPPAQPFEDDTVKEEKMTVYSILEALKNQQIDHVVAESTYGAQPGDDLGDLGVLHELEEGLREQRIHHSIIRAAYYMSNWDASLETARSEGIIYTLYPTDFKLPMVAPKDLGLVASKLLTDDSEGIYYVEGPERYSADDVAIAFSIALGKPVLAKSIPREEWTEYLMNQGFSRKAAESMVAMTNIVLDGKYEMPNDPVRADTTINQYVTELLASESETDEETLSWEKTEYFIHESLMKPTTDLNL